MSTSRKKSRTRLSWRGTLSAPYASLAAAFVNSGRPVMGRYSLSGLDWARASSAFLTALRTYGLPLLSRYAPTPRLILRGSLSALNASVTPGDGKPWKDRQRAVFGTWAIYSRRNADEPRSRKEPKPSPSVPVGRAREDEVGKTYREWDPEDQPAPQTRRRACPRSGRAWARRAREDGQRPAFCE